MVVQTLALCMFLNVMQHNYTHAFNNMMQQSAVCGEHYGVEAYKVRASALNARLDGVDASVFSSAQSDRVLQPVTNLASAVYHVVDEQLRYFNRTQLTIDAIEFYALQMVGALTNDTIKVSEAVDLLSTGTKRERAGTSLDSVWNEMARLRHNLDTLGSEGT